MSSQAPNVAALLPAPATDLVIEQRDIPSPQSDQILVRNEAIAVNPIDWKRQAWGIMIPSFPTIIGSDIAGIVVEAGSSVTNFKPGDRVLGLAHELRTANSDNGAFQTYTVINANAATKVSSTMVAEQAATLPQGVATATMAFFDALGFPLPTSEKFTGSAVSSLPYAILIWGGASSVGFITIQIARLLGLTVFATASKRHHENLRAIGATEVFDYTSPAVLEDISAAAERAGKKITYAIDTITIPETITKIKQLLLSQGPCGTKLAHTGLWPKDEEHVDDIGAQHIRGDDIVLRRADLCGWLFNRALPVWLEEGKLEPIGYRVVDGGVSGIQAALNQLKEGVHGEKVIVKV